MKIGVNQRCPCGSGRKYGKCCLEKEEIKKEVHNFTEKVLDGFQQTNAKFRNTFLEEDVRRNLVSLYLQCKYVSEKLDRKIILGKDIDEEKHQIIYRKATIIQKLIWNPKEIETKKGKVFFKWEGGHEEELSAEEYIDIILSIFSSIFEHYVSLLKSNGIFDCKELAKSLKLDDLKDKIDKPESLNLLYEKLNQETKKEYNFQEISSLFNMKSYKIRCASSHNDYSFDLSQSPFSIVLENGRDRINIVDLLKLSNDILAKLNIFTLIPHLFHINTLPFK